MEIFKEYLKFEESKDKDFIFSEDFRIMGVLIWYYYICHRQVWFMSRNIIPDQDNPLIEAGRTVHEIFYKSEKKEILFENMKIDVIKISEENTTIIGEIKKSSNYLKPSIMQLTLYLYYLKDIIGNIDAKLFIPLEKKTIKVELTKDLENELKDAIQKIWEISTKDTPPKFQKIKFCKNCGFKLLCFS